MAKILKKYFLFNILLILLYFTTFFYFSVKNYQFYKVLNRELFTYKNKLVEEKGKFLLYHLMGEISHVNKLKKQILLLRKKDEILSKHLIFVGILKKTKITILFKTSISNERLKNILYNSDKDYWILSLSLAKDENLFAILKKEKREKNYFYIFMPLILFLLPLLFLCITHLLMRKMGKDNDNQKDILISALSHELKNPLNIINLNLQLLKEELNEVDIENKTTIEMYINNISKQFLWLKNLIDKFFLYIKGQKSVRIPLKLSQFIREISDEWFKYLLSHDIKLSIDIKGKERKIISDKNALRHIFTNIIKNSVDAIEEKKTGGIISIKVEFLPKYVKITVADNGIGMDEKTLSKISVPFFTTKERGLGLGFPIVQTLVKNLRGCITVESEKNKGTKIIIKLPYDA